MTTETTRTTEPLWASEHGRLACRAHLPTPGSDSWWNHRWEMVSPEWREGFERARGAKATCEVCSALAELARLDEAGGAA